MAHPNLQQQVSPRTFSPLTAPGQSPQDGSFLPAAKRQRLSPNGESPYQSPNMANISLPNQVYSRPPYPTQMTNGSNYGNAFNTMNPIPARSTQSPAPSPQPPPQNQQTGVMGPPSKPQVEKPTDLNQLQDVLQGSGIDIAQEDAALINSFRQQTESPHHGIYGGPTLSAYQVKQQPNHYSANLPGGRDSFYGAGTFNQPPVHIRDPEEEKAELEKRAKRVHAEQKQYHLNAPFLNVGLVKKKITDSASQTKVKINSAGVLQPAPNAQPVSSWIYGQDGHERLVTLRGEELLNTDSPLVEILTLVSLAAEERLHALIEDSAALAKSRRTKSLGVAPAEMVELADKTRATEVDAPLPTPSGSATSPDSQGLKRSYSSVNEPPTPVSNESQNPAKTLSYPNFQAEALHKHLSQARSAEEERLRKRRKRDENKSKDASRAGSAAPDSSPAGSSTSLLGERAPDAETIKGGKKISKRAAAAQATEAQQHAATNQTVAGALGLGGNLFGGKKISWLTGGTKTPQKGPALARTMSGVPGSVNANAASKKDASSLPAARSFGEFREDREAGKGIQLRDVLNVLETDGRDKKMLSKAYAKLCPEDGLRRISRV